MPPLELKRCHIFAPAASCVKRATPILGLVRAVTGGYLWRVCHTGGLCVTDTPCVCHTDEPCEPVGSARVSDTLRALPCDMYDTEG